jgi:hypothetical protein
MTQAEKDTIIVFTARSPERIIREGGSKAWVLNPARAKLCKWLVCTQNRHNQDHEFSDATESHGCGFLLGKVSGVQRSGENSERWLITISEFARINCPDLWDHWRNPVRYGSLEELGINLDEVTFEPMSTSRAVPTQPESPIEGHSSAPLTIAEAKRALAVTFGVSPDSIEIAIRG